MLPGCVLCQRSSDCDPGLAACEAPTRGRFKILWRLYMAMDLPTLNVAATLCLCEQAAWAEASEALMLVKTSHNPNWPF